MQRLGKAGRIAALEAVRRLGRALREEPSAVAGETDLFGGGTTWLDRFETVMNTPRIGLRLEKALSGDSEDFDALIAVELAEERALMLAARLAEWLRAQVGDGGEPVTLATFLAHGWPPEPGSDRRVTFVHEFLANLRAELSDAPSEITNPLGDPRELLDWLESESGITHPRVEPTPSGSAKLSMPPLDLPPPSPPTTPAPPIELSEPGPIDEQTSAHPDEPVEPHPDEPIDEHTDEPTEEPVVAAPPTPTPIDWVHEEAERERVQFRRWAFIVQAGWVVLLIIGWRFYQKHRTPLPTPTPRAATPTPVVATPSPRPVAKTTPGAPRLTVPPPTTTPAIPQTPMAPEMTVAPSELHEQALALAAAGHHAEAASLFRRIVLLQAQDHSLGRLPRALVYARLASSLAALERWDEADASVERAQALLEELLPTHDAETALGVEMVADYWASRERWPLAARLYQKSVQTYEGTNAENSNVQLSVVNRLAGALRQIGEVTRAEQLYRNLVKSYQGMGAIAGIDAATASHNLGNVLLVTNRAGEALKFYEQAFTWLAKVDPSSEQAKRLGVLMEANYARCLVATGIPAEEANTRAQKALPAKLR